MPFTFPRDFRAPEGAMYCSLRAQDIDGTELKPGDVLPADLPMLQNNVLIERLLRSGYIQLMVDVRQTNPVSNEVKEQTVKNTSVRRGRR